MPIITIKLALLLLLSVSAQASDIVVPMKEKGTSTYYVDAQIGNEEIDLLVDTGAGYTALNRNLLKILKASGHAERRGDIEGVLANGDILILPVYQVTEINLGGCVIRDIEVAETPANTRNLLGLNTLKKAAPFTFALTPASLHLSNCSGQLARLDN